MTWTTDRVRVAGWYWVRVLPALVRPGERITPIYLEAGEGPDVDEEVWPEPILPPGGAA